MKIAILMSGQLRTCWYSIESILENIIIPNNAYVFFYTGTSEKNFISFQNRKPIDSSCTMYESRGREKSIKIDEKKFLEEKLNNYLKSFQKSDYDDKYIENYDNILNKTRCDNIDFAKKYCKKSCFSDLNGYVVAQYLLLKQCLFLLEEYEILNNIKYDFIIRLRPDMSIKNKLIINKNFKKEDLFVQRDFGKVNMRDYFFMGKSEIMKNICKNFVEKYGYLRFKKEDEILYEKTFITENQFGLFV